MESIEGRLRGARGDATEGCYGSSQNRMERSRAVERFLENNYVMPAKLMTQRDNIFCHR